MNTEDRSALIWLLKERADMLGVFADMLGGTELEQIQTHFCKFSRPSVPYNYT